MKKVFNIGFIARAAIIAAMYAALTILLEPISYGLIQFRISEALSILPFFTPAAIPGLFVGCIIANLLGPYGVLDIVIGSFATLAAAIMTYKIKDKYLAPIPAIVVNALVVGPLVAYYCSFPFYSGILYVGIGQIGVCYFLGLPLLFALTPYKDRIFGKNDKKW